MLFRVGIHLGDVLVHPDGRVYGDGVNVAARLQALAEPGGVCVSEVVHAAVGTKIPAVFEALGEQQLKNIVVPVSVYRARFTADAVLPEPGPESGSMQPGPERSTLVFASPLMQRLVGQVDAVARTAANVLIEGESGVGKELIARRIHEESGRFRGPFVKLDCASIPANLFEAEWFGQVSGVVPGSFRDRAGRLELADGGSLFLDEVGDIPAELQAKLLGPLQTRHSSAWATAARVERTRGSSRRPAGTSSSRSRGDSSGAIFTSG